MITQWMLTIVTFLLGVWIGYMWGKQTTIDKTIQTLSKHISKPFRDELKVGAVKRPNVVQLNNLQEPASMREGKEAIKEALDQIPEIQEHKRILAEQQKLARRRN